MTEALAPVQVELRVPADAEMSRVVRLTAAGVASLAGSTIDEMDDVKLAASEVFLALVEHGGGGVIDVRFVASDGGFEVSGRTAADDFDLSHPDLLLCRTVLDSVCTSHGIELADGTARIWASVARVPVE